MTMAGRAVSSPCRMAYPSSLSRMKRSLLALSGLLACLWFLGTGATSRSAPAVQSAAHARHWAYAKPLRPAVPEVKGATWCRNPIDHFILARLEKEGLRPSPEAPKERLIRRVYLDLIGLPPSPAAVEAF